jgi:hypothetical protein
MGETFQRREVPSLEREPTIARRLGYRISRTMAISLSVDGSEVWSSALD